MISDTDKAIAARVRARRLALLALDAEWTQARVSALLGLDRSAYAYRERGERPFLPSELWNLAQAFGVRVEFFFSDSPGAIPGETPCLPLSPCEQRELLDNTRRLLPTKTRRKE